MSGDRPTRPERKLTMNKVKKRILSLITSAAIAVASIGVLPELGNLFPEAEIPAFGGIFRGFDVPTGAEDPVTEVGAWNDLQMAFRKGGTIKLTSDITAVKEDSTVWPALEVPIGVTATLDLNGHKLDRGLSGATAAAGGNVITVRGNLTVKDSSSTKTGIITGGNTTGNGGGVRVKSGSFRLESGTISGNSAKNYGGGVYIAEYVPFTMTGGTISGNSAVFYGGGVYNSGTFTMTGGTISGNSADFYGGGVYNSGTFFMTGGAISGNSAKDFGGGVYNEGTFDLSGGTISENKANVSSGGGVYNQGTFDLSGGAISGNSATEKGGGVYTHNGSTFTMTGGTIGGTTAADKNTAKNGGGVYIAEYGTFDLSGGEINGNTATENGGGVYNYYGTFTMYDGTISGNTATEKGGGVYNEGTFTMSDGKINGNSATDHGGGVYACNGRKFTMTGGEITDNTVFVNFGGGVFVAGESTEFTMSGGTISGNTAGFGGGVNVSASSTFTMSGGKISENKAYTSGSGVYNEGTFTMSGGTIGGNTATSEGGGVYNNGTFTMSGGEISGNSATENGGGVYNFNTFTMSGGTISGNKTTGNSSKGGGVYNKGTFTMTGGSISENTAKYGGGGVYVYGYTETEKGTFTMSGGNISGNSAEYGGGVYVNNGTFDLSGGTISGNSATLYGGGVYNIGTFNISGSPFIAGNKKGTAANNVYLNVDKTLIVTGALTAGACVGVNYGTGHNAVIAVGGGSHTNIWDDKWYIFSDAAGYKVICNNSQLELLYSVDYVTTASDLAGLNNLLKNADVPIITLTGNINCDSPITIDAGISSQLNTSVERIVTIDLNGYKIDRGLAGETAVNNGSVIIVYGTLTLMDSSTGKTGTITGGNCAGEGGGVYVDGTFIMNGGTISGNSAIYGGGVFVDNDATFIMNGGEITGNSAGTNSDNGVGGGVFVYSTNGKFTMTGGVISSNTATYGGGVTVDTNGLFNVSGSPEVDEVALPGSKKINVTGVLSSDAKLGVKLLNNSGVSTYGVITSGLKSGDIIRGTAANFKSVDNKFRVSINATSGEAELVDNHSLEYSVSDYGKTINATCTTCDFATYLTIAKPALTAYDGSGSELATLTGLDAFNAATGLKISARDIEYYKGSTKLPFAPTDAGPYTAQITAGGATASVEYTIDKAACPTGGLPATLTADVAGTTITVTSPAQCGERYEYSKDGSTWQKSPVFTGLTTNTEYTVKARIAASENYAASDYTISSSVKTPITIPMTGTAEVGQTLTLDLSVIPSEWSYSNIQWKRFDGFNDSTISVASSSTYKVTDDDKGYWLFAEITLQVNSNPVKVYTDYTAKVANVTYTHHPYSAPGCTYGGNLEYYTDQYNNYYTKKGDTYTKTTASAVLLSAYGHDYMWTTTKEPTCTEPGEKTCVCLNCGDTDTVTIKALGHKKSAPVEEITVEPTCTEDGSGFDVVKCENCGEEISRTEKVIKALGHKPATAVEEVTVPATCTEDGSGFDVVKCERCGEEISRTAKVLPALGHDLETVRVNEKEADCMTDGGYDEITRCKRCGQEISRKSVVVQKLGHEFENGVCTRCGAIEIKSGKLAEILPTLTGDKVVIALDGDETMPKITFPKNVKELTIDGGGHTVTFTGGSITMKPFGKLILANVTIKAAKDGKPQNITLTAAAGGLVLENVKFEGKKTTINAKKGDLTLGDITAADLYINGNAKTNLTVDGAVNATKIMNFGKLLLGSTLTASKALNIGTITFAEGSVLNAATGAAITFKNGLSGNGTINLAEGFKPLTIKGTISGRIMLTTDKPLTEGTQIFKSSLTNLNDVFDVHGIAPVVNDGTYKYGLYVKSNKAYLRAFKLQLGNKNFCEISDLMDSISAAKDSSKIYEMNVLGDMQLSSLNLPKKGTYKGLTINGNGHTMTLQNNALTLTGDLTLENVTIASAKGAWTIKTNGFKLTADPDKLINCTIK